MEMSFSMIKARIGETQDSDERRRLSARLGGLLKKKVALQWRDARAAGE